MGSIPVGVTKQVKGEPVSIRRRIRLYLQRRNHMYNDEKGRRIMALSITHYVYRNTRLEDFHAECVQMDRNFYRIIYNTVRTKLKNVRELQRYIDSFPDADLTNKATLDKLINSVPKELQLKFIRYLQDIMFGLFFGTNWDTAVQAEKIRANQSYANYVLAGKFNECCQNGCVLNDATMRIINKDVHNRIYTLLTGGYFN